MENLHGIFQEMGFKPPMEWQSDAVVYSIGRTANLLVRELAAVYQRFGLTVASFNLLMLLKHGADPDSFSQQALGQRLVVSPSDMTGLIDRLEQKGWVRRQPGKDRRSKRLEITPKGAKLLDEVWPQHKAALQRCISPLSKSEAQAVVRGLAHMRQALEGE